MSDIQTLKSKMMFALEKGRNVLLVGRHGTGKSSLMLECLEEAKLKYLYFSTSTLDPWVDFIGVPKEVTKNGETVLEMIPPKALADNDVQAIVLDEFNRSHKKIRNAVMELIQFKSINGRRFPKLKVVWAAINPEDDEEATYDVEELDFAQEDRFHVKLFFPNAPDAQYFSNKYGKDITVRTLEWWKELPKERQLKVSPRRLDYALSYYNEGGDLCDVLPQETNPVKLIALLTHGDMAKKLQTLESSKEEKKKEFFATFDNIRSAIPYMKKSEAYMEAFLPFFNREILTELYTEDNEIRSFMDSHGLNFHDFFEDLAESDSVPANIKANARQILNKTQSAQFFGSKPATTRRKANSRRDVSAPAPKKSAIVTEWE